MSCRELVELVTDYLDGALPPDRRAEVAAHFAECADCRRYLDQLQLTGHVVASLSTTTLTPAQRAEAVAAFRAWCTADHPPGDVRRPWWRRVTRLTFRRPA